MDFDIQGTRIDGSLVRWKFHDECRPKLRALLSLWCYQFKRDEKADEIPMNAYTDDFLFVIGKGRDSARLYHSWIARDGLNPVYVDGIHTHPSTGIETIRGVHAKMSPGPYRRRHCVGLQLPLDPEKDDERDQEYFVAYNYYSGRDLNRLDLLDVLQRERVQQRESIPTTIVYAQFIFSIFMQHLVKKIAPLEGFGMLRSGAVRISNEELCDEALQLRHPAFEELASVFVKSGLGSEEEAYVCIIPAFAVLKNLPQPGFSVRRVPGESPELIRHYNVRSLDS